MALSLPFFGRCYSRLMKLLYPTSLELDIELLGGFAVSLYPYAVNTPLPLEHHDADILVTWGNSSEMLQDAAQNLSNLRWIQSLAAGPNDVLNAGFGKHVVVTTGSGLHDRAVAEHALGLLLNAARRFYEMRDLQNARRWPGHLGGLQNDRAGESFRSLQGARVLVWGFGNIARTLAPSLRLLGAHVRGVARSAGVRGGTEVFTEDTLPELLPETDALVMILPGSEGTTGALSAARLSLLPPHAWAINVGRGSSVDEAALNEALRAGRIGGAALDVFGAEPLPNTSPLWDAPNLILSPHAAGGRPQGAEALITENLRRFLAGQPLQNPAER